MPPFLVVYPGGLVDMSTFGEYTSNCDFSFKYFPFDYQKCAILFQSYYPSSDVLLTMNPGFVADSFLPGGSNWKLLGIEPYSNGQVPVQIQMFNRSRAMMIICLERDPTFYILNIFIPVYSLVILILLSLAIPADTERCSFAITVLLSFTVTQGTVSQNIPQTSEIVYASYFLTLQVALGCLLTLYSIFASGLSRKKYYRQSMILWSSSSIRLSRVRLLDLKCFVITFIVEILITLFYFGNILLYNSRPC